MPLHDWRDARGWNNLHSFWLTYMVEWVQDRLPSGYRAYQGSVPALMVEPINGRPDVTVRRWRLPDDTPAATTAALAATEPDMEAVATLELDPSRALHIDLHGQLIAAVELVSPRNKDRPESRERSTRRYAGYLHNDVHLLLIDVLPLPLGFSFADAIFADVGLPQPPTPTPFAVSLRVGESVPEGTVLAVWRRPLAVGAALPTIDLPLTVRESVPVDLEHTYHQAARRAYLD